MVYFTFPLECIIGISKLGTAKTERASFPHSLSKWDCIYTHLSKWLSNPSRIQWLRPKILWLTLIPFTSYVQPVIKPWRSYLQKRIWLFMTSTAFISFGAYHFLLRLPKQHPKRSSCLCPFTVILKSLPRVMLLKMYGRSCHSSVQNLPSALSPSQSRSPRRNMATDLYNLSMPTPWPILFWLYLFVPLPLFISPASPTFLMFCEHTGPTLSPKSLHLLFPDMFSQIARWLAPLPTFRSFYTWHLLN